MRKGDQLSLWAFVTSKIRPDHEAQHRLFTAPLRDIRHRDMRTTVLCNSPLMLDRGTLTLVQVSYSAEALANTTQDNTEGLAILSRSKSTLDTRDKPFQGVVPTDHLYRYSTGISSPLETILLITRHTQLPVNRFVTQPRQL